MNKKKVLFVCTQNRMRSPTKDTESAMKKYFSSALLIMSEMKQKSESITWPRARNKRMPCVESYKKKKMIIRTVIISVSIFLFANIIIGNNGLIIYFQRKAAVEKYGKEIQKMSNQIDEAKKEIDAIKNSEKLFEFEQRARDLGFTYQGEIVYKFNKLEPERKKGTEKYDNEME